MTLTNQERRDWQHYAGITLNHLLNDASSRLQLTRIDEDQQLAVIALGASLGAMEMIKAQRRLLAPPKEEKEIDEPDTCRKCGTLVPGGGSLCLCDACIDSANC